MSQTQSNAEKLKAVRDKIASEKKELTLARQLAEEATKNLKLENAKAAQQARELMTQLSLALATFNAKLDEGKAEAEKDQSRFTAALEAALSKEAVAKITDEQMQALGNTITAMLAEFKKLLPKQSKLDMGSFKIELADKLVTDKDVKKIVDAIPDSISGKVTLAEYSKKDPATKYLNVRLTDGIKFLDGMRSGGGATAGGGGGAVLVDPFIEYITQDEAPNDTGVSYYGFAKKNGVWYVMERDKTTTPYTDRYANASNNEAIADYQAAWTARASLDYDYVFNLKDI